MTNPSALFYELVVIPDCLLPFLQLTGTPVKNEPLIKKGDKGKEGFFKEGRHHTRLSPKKLKKEPKKLKKEPKKLKKEP
ncbi:hypothetical protein AVEN_130218-1, partial [Araneus ventricosus]